MAINTAAHSPKEFQILVAPEATVGTAPAGSAFKAIEADSISMPTYNDLRVIEQRAGSVGRVVNTGDLLSHEEGAVHEFSVAGVMTEELWPILIPAALGVAASSSACTLASNFEATSYVYGATSSGAHQSVSFHVNGLADADTSATGNSYAIPGCVVTSLKITANSQENGGRLMFELTAQTRNTLTAAGAAKLSGFADFSTNFMYLADYTQDKKIGGQIVSLDSLDLTIENPVAFLGNKTVSGFEGTPESLIRMVPGLDVTCAAVVKYDDNVDQFFQMQKELTAITSDACTLADNGTFSSASLGGISIPAGVITECAFDEGDYLKLAFTVKMIDNGSGNLISVRVA